MNHDQYCYNPEWHQRGIASAWDLLDATSHLPKGRCLRPNVADIARYHGAPEPVVRQLVDLLKADWSGMNVLWVERLRDLDGWCAGRHQDLAKYLDPDQLSHMIASRLRSLDPFDPDTLRTKAFLAACEAGGDFVTTDIATGEEVDRFSLPGTRHGAASEN